MALTFKLPRAREIQREELNVLRALNFGPCSRMQGEVYLSGASAPCVVVFPSPPGEVFVGQWVLRVSEIGGFIIMQNGELSSGCFLGPEKVVLNWNSRWFVSGFAIPYCDLAKTTAKIAEQARWTRPERAEGVSS